MRKKNKPLIICSSRKHHFLTTSTYKSMYPYLINDQGKHKNIKDLENLDFKEYRNIICCFILLNLLIYLFSNPIESNIVQKNKEYIGEKNIFSVLTYNVDGLPWIFSGEKGSVNIKKISKKINKYDIVAVQEDFAYHSNLIQFNKHKYYSNSSGNVPLGDGLNFFSSIKLTDIYREEWRKRNGIIFNESDELTPKGFMYAKFEIRKNVFIDIYNIHADAGNDMGSINARRDNMLQLSEYIEKKSSQNTIIILGDFNTKYSNENENIKKELISKHGFYDFEMKLIETSKIKDSIDKILYRNGRDIKLYPEKFKIEKDYFVDEEKMQLSDHKAISGIFRYDY